MIEHACKNTDKEIWRKTDSFYSPSIHVTNGGCVGINVGGHVIVAPVELWHKAGEMFFCVDPDVSAWRHSLVMWLIKR